MFFEKESISFNILDVLKLNQRNINMHNTERNFSALSYRFRSDAVLKTESGTYPVGDNCVCYFPARLNYSRIAEVDEMIIVHFDTTNYSGRAIEFFEPKNPNTIAPLFRKILDCWRKKEVGYRLRASAILYEIFAECYAQAYVEAEATSKIQKSLDFIAKNYKKSDLSIKEIADKSFMSEVYFRKLFKKEYGTSPQKYIINMRIQNALGLISTGYYSLTEVAYLCGYNDYKYFSVEFKKHVGISPSEYLYNYGK